MISVLSLLIVLSTFFALISIAYPIRPFTSRKQALAALALSIVASGVLGALTQEPRLEETVATPQVQEPNVDQPQVSYSKPPRTFSEEEFYWDKDTSAHKRQIVSNVQKIYDENDQCLGVDVGSVTKSPTRSKPGAPVFFVTCTKDGQPFNVWFSLGDSQSGKSFEAKKPISQGSAILMCEEAAKQSAMHPSTVSFSRLLDAAFQTYPSGRARLTSSFTAKNSFNLETNHWINCLFEGEQIIDVQIGEQ